MITLGPFPGRVCAKNFTSVGNKLGRASFLSYSLPTNTQRQIALRAKMQDDIKKLMISLLPRLRAYARAISRSADIADDLVQQCCEKALRNISSFEPGTRLDLWLFRILRNGWIDQVRARRQTFALQDMEGAGQELPGEDGRRIVEARLQLSAV